MTNAPRYTAFVRGRCIARGPSEKVLPVLKARWDDDRGFLPLVFEDESGRQVDFDLRGSLEEAVARAAGEPTPGARGPGRPKLGIVSREVSLLPRHWEWLEDQPNGISAALRRLVEQARHAESDGPRAERLRAGVSRMLTALAGDLPNYEEATRALFAGERTRFEKLVTPWPADVRRYAIARVRAVERVARAAGGVKPPRERASGLPSRPGRPRATARTKGNAARQ